MRMEDLTALERAAFAEFTRRMAASLDGEVSGPSPSFLVQLPFKDALLIYNALVRGEVMPVDQYSGLGAADG